MRSKASIKSHPIHPMMIAFPVGLLIASFAFDVIGNWRGYPGLTAAGWYCAIAGIVGGLLAAVPGAIDLFGAVPPNSSARNRGYLHAALNVLALILFAIVVVMRGGPDAVPAGLSLLVSLLGVIVLGFSGWLGGTLVYRNQIGVDHRYANAGQLKERVLKSWNDPACNPGELSEGQMMLLRVDGERVVIGRCPEGIAAFSDHCTHRGGPLSDGALVGCTVQCPWHGSQFDVHSGRVVTGPANSKIKTYETEIRGGEVYVLPKSREQKAA